MDTNSFRPGISAALILAGALLFAERGTALDLSDVLPELRVIAAPPSVREGMRLTYYVAVATVAQTFAEEWVDEAGKTNTLNTPTPSGHGYTQVDVIAVSPRYTALRVQPWLFYNFDGPSVPQFGSDESLVSYAGGGDWFAHPDVLAKVSQILTPELKILRMPLKVGNRIYDALRVQAEDGKSRQVLSYDLQTGYLLYKGSVVQGEETTTLSQAYFQGARDLAIPWRGGLMPGWVATTDHLRYEGSYTAVAVGSNPLTLPLSAALEISARDDDWFVYTQTTTLGSLPGLPPTVGTRTLATGINQLGGLCLPPAAIRSLNPNQRIDRDEFTGATIDVTHVGTLATGRMGVTLRMSAGEAAWSEVTYDALSGLALELKTFDGPSPFYFTQTELQLTELPAIPPAAPRLSISWAPNRRTVLISCPTEAGRFVTFFTSKDGCRTWQTVPGYQDRAGTGDPLVCTADIGSGSVFYRVEAR